MDPEALPRAQELLARAQRILVLTGAGISTDSGIPDYRGPRGVWTTDPAAERTATIEAYRSSPGVRRRAWQQRLELFSRGARPNEGHRALVDLERTGRLHTLLTQNIDGLHLAAGSSPELVVEVHGTVREVVCLACGERSPMEHALERVRAGEADPPCRACGGILKSATVSFGQSLVAADLARADQAARECDLLLAIGTTLAVHPICLVVPLAKRCGARVVILNAEPTTMDELADVVVRGPIGALLVRMLGA